MTTRLSLVLPAYNEEANVERTLELFRGQLEARFGAGNFEIVVVDDASTDRTAALAEALAKRWPELRVLRNPVNLGAGTSVWIGMKAARGELVLHDSMDRPFDLADLDGVLALFPTSDVVVVERHDRSANTPWRKLTSFVNSCLLRLLFRPGLRDMNFVQCYKREVLQAVQVRAKSPAFVTPELIIRAQRRDFRVSRFGAPFHRREKGAASYGKPRDILWTLADMLAFRLEL